MDIIADKGNATLELKSRIANIIKGTQHWRPSFKEFVAAHIHAGVLEPLEVAKIMTDADPLYNTSPEEITSWVKTYSLYGVEGLRYENIPKGRIGELTDVPAPNPEF